MKTILNIILYIVTFMFGLFGLIEISAVLRGGTNPIFQLCFGLVLLGVAFAAIRLARKD